MLIDPAKSIFDPREIASTERTQTERRGLRRWVPSLSLNRQACVRYRQMRDMLSERGGSQLVLVVGAGEGGEGVSVLQNPNIRIVASDVALGPSTDLCLDAHNIPFADQAFDGVVVQAVLEHVLDPYACVAEIARVLKVDGVVYAETPFMQQVHMGAHDFTRFTSTGHARLFREFTPVSTGVAVGPGSALAWSLVYFLMSFTDGGMARRVLNIGGRFGFFWLKYFDIFLNRRVAAQDAAAGYFFLGLRSRTARSEAEIVNSYPGAFGR